MTRRTPAVHSLGSARDATALVSGGVVSRVEAPRVLVEHRPVPLQGRRGIRGTRMPWHRRFSNSVTTRMISRLARRPVYDAQCGFRMYRLSALEAMGLPREGRFEWESQALVLCGRRGFSIVPVDIATVYTDNGSHMRLLADTLRFLRMYLRLAALPEAAWTR